MRARITRSLILLLLAPSAASAMSWCSERELMFESADMCAAVCPSACTEATRRTDGSSGSCSTEYRGFVYSPALNRTYALTAANYGVDGLASAPDYSGRGVILKSKSENDVVALLTGFYDFSAWIAAEAFTAFLCGKTGRYYFDGTSCAAACSGVACTPATDLPDHNTVRPERFFWRNGDALSYRNFAAGEPDNAADSDDIRAGFAPKGEYWVEMGPEGKWRDAGKHVADQAHSRPILVQFSGALDCVNGETVPANPETPGDLAGSVCGKDADGDGQLTADEFRQCIFTMDGTLCPIDAVDCEPEYNPVVCPEGGVLDTARDMCQVDPTITCPAGYTWDQVADRCVGPVICPDSGVLNGISDRCEKIPATVCPTGYTFDASQGICVAPPSCRAGAYVSSRDRCEFAWTPSCPGGWVLDASTGICGRAPRCSSGSYNAAFNLCMKSNTNSCPAGYNFNTASGRCEAPPQCLQGTFDPSTDKCMWTSIEPAQYSCPAPSVLSGDQCVTTESSDPDSEADCRGHYSYCVAAALGWFPCDTPTGLYICLQNCNLYCGSPGNRCDSGFTYNPDTLKCERQTSTSAPLACPPGWLLDTVTMTCTLANQVNPSCPGGSFDYAAHLCFTSPGTGCNDGFSYDAGSGQCVKSPDCGTGVLNAGSDRCELAVTRNCGAYSLDTVANVCYSQTVCDPGVYDPARNICVGALIRECGASYTLDAASGICRDEPSCPPDPAYPLSATIAYSTAMDMCVSDPVHDCPVASGYAYIGPPVSKCEVIPVCVRGSYDPSRDSCLTGDLTCPYGDYRCMRNGERLQCSPHSCGDTEELESDGSSYQDDGERDENGRCLGRIYIFNGRPGECKEPGVSTTWFQCCSTDEGNFLFIEKVCGTGDKLTASAMKARRTHFVGTYCKKKFPLIGCVQSAQVHCVFESKLGRIVQEQGRMQLKNFQEPFGPDWGTPEIPNCRGFTPEEFQFLDFSKMDLSEFFADIKAKAASAIKGELKEKIDDFYDNITH